MVETPRLQARQRAWECGRVFATTSMRWSVVPVSRPGHDCVGTDGPPPECWSRRAHLQGTSVGGPVLKPGSKAAGTGSIDVADGVVRLARRRENLCATVSFQLTATKLLACRRWLFNYDNVPGWRHNWNAKRSSPTSSALRQSACGAIAGATRVATAACGATAISSLTLSSIASERWRSLPDRVSLVPCRNGCCETGQSLIASSIPLPTDRVKAELLHQLVGQNIRWREIDHQCQYCRDRDG